jgi:hypothetical protein
MKVYSSVLTDHDLSAAIRGINASRPQARWIGFERRRTLVHPRIRPHGWNVLLYRNDSARTFNSGQYGAGRAGAASWDDWGEFLAVLFQRDPGLRVGRRYDGYIQFHKTTQWRYAKFSGWGELGIVYDDCHDQPRTDIATDGACGRSWNDALGTSRTPAPSARCPYEDEHQQMGLKYG